MLRHTEFPLGDKCVESDCANCGMKFREIARTLADQTALIRSTEISLVSYFNCSIITSKDPNIYNHC
jgi:hypothetical protein